jgi:glucokinase
MKFLGIDIGGTKSAVCVGTADGTILCSKRIPTRSPEGYETGIGRIVELAKEVVADAKISLADIAAVGISAPGPVSLKQQLMLEPPNMKGWKNVPLIKLFTEALGRPTYMNNDANACALAEFMYGSCKGTPNLVYLTMSTGLGAGFVVDGKVVQGTNDLAGEIGHHVLDIHGPPCPCGLRGCLELYCGGMNVANRLREQIVTQTIKTAILDQAGGDPARIDFKCFADAVRLKDPFALLAWEEYLERLAQGVGTVIMFMNPEVIVMGTIAIHAGDLLLDPLRKSLYRFAWKHAIEACRVVPSSLGAQIGDLSALAIAVSEWERQGHPK